MISQAIEKDPNNAILYFNLGVVNNDLGDSESARNFYEKAIEIDPTYESAYFNLTSLILSGESVIVDEMNSLGTSRADNARYETLKSERESLYMACVPFLKNLIEINNNIEAIKTIGSMSKRNSEGYISELLKTQQYLPLVIKDKTYKIVNLRGSLSWNLRKQN